MECNTCRARRYEDPLRRLFRNLKSSAKRRRKEFELEFEFFRDFAEWTGYAAGHGRGGEALHVDRIDVRSGYTPDNIQIITGSENAAKRWRDYAPF